MSKKIADVVNAARPAADAPASYHEWMRSLTDEQRQAEYKRADESTKYRINHEKAMAVEQRLADLGENPLPNSLIGVRFVKNEDCDYESQVGADAFTVLGLQGRHGSMNMPDHVSHRFVLLRFDDGEITILGVEDFFEEILNCYKIDSERNAAVNDKPFVPPYLVGKTFRANKDAKHHNWFGYDEFTVVGDVGPWIVPAAETSRNVHAVMAGQVCVEVDGGLMAISRNEFMDLTGAAKRLYKLVK